MAKQNIKLPPLLDIVYVQNNSQFTNCLILYSKVQVSHDTLLLHLYIARPKKKNDKETSSKSSGSDLESSVDDRQLDSSDDREISIENVHNSETSDHRNLQDEDFQVCQSNDIMQRVSGDWIEVIPVRLEFEETFIEPFSSSNLGEDWVNISLCMF